MSYTSLSFPVFIAVFALFYFLLPGKYQKYMLLAGNYVFYMWWKPAFGVLIFGGTLISYFAALAFEKELLGRKKLWITLGVCYNIGVLFVFKYLDFFCTAFTRAMGLRYGHELTFLLPVGISFFTFSAAGYLFDVYRGKLAAENSFINFSVFVSFFPTIMAGPIGYARNFLPQLKTPKQFDKARAKRGILRFSWGMVKKMVVADTLAIIVNTVYADAINFSNGLILLAAVAYSMQIYFDFSAYSDMAIGTADFLGFSVMENFDAPYLVTSVKSFWKKWHISLTSWLREYIYFPLGGSRCGKWRTYFNVMVVFAVSGLWHGAAFSFVIWGLLNGAYQVIGEITLPARKKLHAILRIREDGRTLWLWRCAVTFGLVTIAWIFFRAGSVTQGLYLVRRILSIITDGFGGFALGTLGLMKRQAIMLTIYTAVFVSADIYLATRRSLPELEKTDFAYWGIILGLALSVIFFGVYGWGFNPQDFVYFKF